MGVDLVIFGTDELYLRIEDEAAAHLVPKE